MKNGYEYVKKSSHPNANKNGWIKRSRYLVSLKLGRALRDTEDVHHINGNKLDDRIENLELMEHITHSSFHLSKRPPRKTDVCYCTRGVNTKTYKGYEIRGFNLKKIFRLASRS